MNTTTPREIILIDDLPPEVIAMVQALYSRSPKSVKEHLKKVSLEGADKFMDMYYVQYGHKSIADCGSTTIFAENVSMLGAKGIQNWPLYSGQEASTRYLDFKGRDIVDPLDTPESRAIHVRWMTLYRKALEVLVPCLTEKYPRIEGEDENKYKKAVLAKAFDIARGFLPAGMTTFASWHTNLRQAEDHLKTMRHHPLDEMKNIAGEMQTALLGKYPGTFGRKRYEEEEAYLALSRAEIEYSDADNKGMVYDASFVRYEIVEQYWKLFTERPAKTELPHELRKCGAMNLSFPLDFGSFRDAQRQRSWVLPMPLLTLRHGFHQWYLDNLPESFREEAIKEIAGIAAMIKELPCDKYARQYYIGMGYTVICEPECNLPSMVYIIELRAAQSVHSTLRPIAQWMAGILKEQLPGIALHFDNDPDEWTTKRGAQDIVEKK